MNTKEAAKTYVKNHSPDDKPLKYWQKAFYKYCGGCYYLIDEINIDIDRFLYKMYYKERTTITTTNNILANMKHLVRLPSVQADVWLDVGNYKHPAVKLFIKKAIKCLDDYKTLCFNNGLLLTSPSGRTLFIPHSPNYFTLTKLPYNYDPDAKCPHWLEFLERMMEGDKERIILLQQWAKYILGDNLRLQKFLLCSGEGANGKSVYTEVLELLVGLVNCSHISLSDFASRFALYHTLNKKINTTTESSRQQNPKAVELFKAFSSGNTMTFEIKGGAHFDTKPTAKAMISTNELPDFKDKSKGIWRRMLLVQFKVNLPEAEWDTSLVKNTLSKEISGIFNWANKADLSKGFTIPKDSKRAMIKYRQDTDPARAFLEENYTFGKGHVATQNLFSLYKLYCNAVNCIPVDKVSFGKSVFSVFPNISVGKTAQKNGSKRVNTYQGLVEKKFDNESKSKSKSKNKKKMVRLILPDDSDDYYVDDDGREWHKENMTPQEE